ncbi:MAG: hypothetical protein KAI39_01600 [Desulfobulbaceae bacterium]|nr:hypothetical protein [Desulfobulbaceae bacterium]
MFRDSEGQSDVITPVGQQENEEKIRSDEALFCRSCLNQITRREEAIRINGSHAHTFFNPEGIVFELGCFREAPGCLSMGEATSDFTWFAGSVWRFVLCRNCGVHLGWFYEMKESGFYGLIFSRLRE